MLPVAVKERELIKKEEDEDKALAMGQNRKRNLGFPELVIDEDGHEIAVLFRLKLTLVLRQISLFSRRQRQPQMELTFDL